MTFMELLKTNPDKILFDATEFLSRSNLENYNKLNPERLRAKLARLYFITRECAEQNSHEPVAKYISEIAPNRFESGFELYEVQTAINILEECFWKNIVEKVDENEKLHALVKSHEILCAAKESLAKSFMKHKKEVMV
jgi:hypothetical protein